MTQRLQAAASLYGSPAQNSPFDLLADSSQQPDVQCHWLRRGAPRLRQFLPVSTDRASAHRSISEGLQRAAHSFMTNFSLALSVVPMFWMTSSLRTDRAE